VRRLSLLGVQPVANRPMPALVALSPVRVLTSGLLCCARVSGVCSVNAYTKLWLTLNDHFTEAIEGIAKEAGAIIPCPECEHYDVFADDPDAKSKAYAMATKAFERGEFQGVSLKQVRDEMAAVLLDANRDCPGCERMLDDRP
jgi:hypothetical protein